MASSQAPHSAACFAGSSLHGTSPGCPAVDQFGKLPEVDGRRQRTRRGQGSPGRQIWRRRKVRKQQKPLGGLTGGAETTPAPWLCRLEAGNQRGEESKTGSLGGTKTSLHTATDDSNAKIAFQREMWRFW